MLAPLFSLLVAFGQSPAIAPDSKITDLKDGYVKVTTPQYTIELPKGWSVGNLTPWGARAFTPAGKEGEMGVMTGPGTQTWDQIYKISLVFLQRDGKGKPTPYKLSKTKKGVEACTFAMVDDTGFAFERFFMVKDAKKGLLALSVKVPSKSSDAEWTKHFDRLVTTATFR
jgi:hypothetical protein